MIIWAIFVCMGNGEPCWLQTGLDHVTPMMIFHSKAECEEEIKQLKFEHPELFKCFSKRVEVWH